jgi:hypothetical protein
MSHFRNRCTLSRAPKIVPATSRLDRIPRTVVRTLTIFGGRDMTRRIFAALTASCFLALLAMTAPSTSGAGTAQVSWGLQQLFGSGNNVQADLGGTTVGTAVQNYVQDNTSSWTQAIGEQSGAMLDDLMNTVGNLDPVIITAETTETITAGAAAEAGGIIGAEVGTAIAPVVGTLIGFAVGAL